MSGTLTITSKRTSLSMAREVKIQGLSQVDALRLAETAIVPFLRMTGGDVAVVWSRT